MRPPSCPLRRSYAVEKWIFLPVPTGKGGTFEQSIDRGLASVRAFATKYFSCSVNWTKPFNGKKIKALAFRVIEVAVLGTTQFVFALSLYLLPEKIARYVVLFFVEPGQFLPDECENRTVKEIALMVGTMVPAFFTAHLCNQIFTPLASKEIVFVTQRMEIVKWIDSTIGIANIFSAFMIYIAAKQMYESGKTIRLETSVGCLGDFYTSKVPPLSGAIKVMVEREFVVTLPAYVLKILAQDIVAYLEIGEQAFDSGLDCKQYLRLVDAQRNENDSLRVIFPREPAEGNGVTTNFYLSFLASLLVTDGGRFKGLFSLDQDFVRQKGYSGTIQQFYKDLGLFFGSMTRSMFGPTIRSLISPEDVEAICEVSEEEAKNWETNSSEVKDSKEIWEEHKDLVRRVGRKLFAQDKSIVNAFLGEIYQEDMDGIISEVSNVITFSTAARKFYPRVGESFSWDLYRGNGYFMDKLRGNRSSGSTVAHRIKLMSASNDGDVPKKIGWIKEWLRQASADQVDAFLLFISGQTTLKEQRICIYPIQRKVTQDLPIKASTCTSSISLPTTSKVGLDDTKENFLAYLEAVIVSTPNDLFQEKFTAM